MKNRTKILIAVLLVLLLAGCAGEAAPAEVPEPSNVPGTAEAPEATESPETTEEPGTVDAEAVGDETDPNVLRLASAKKQIRNKKVGRYGMVPVYGRDIKDGVYPVHVDSSSPFFKIAAAELIVEDGELYGRITIPSMSYLYVYPGTIKQARNAAKDTWIGFEEVEHQTVFTIPVRALDTEMECAAYSKARKKWYARQLVFYASSLPADALLIDLPDYELIEAAVDAFDLEGVEELLSAPQAAQAGSLPPPEAVYVDLPDGEYSIEVNMTGGSGRASISSPTLLIVRGGRAYARLIWSSAYYDYMTIEKDWFYNLTTDGGNSTFEIPITAMDDPISVVADTTAMGDPLEIEYTLTFYSDSIGEKGQIPQEAAKKVLVIAAVIIVAGGVLNWYVKKKRA